MISRAARFFYAGSSLILLASACSGRDDAANDTTSAAAAAANTVGPNGANDSVGNRSSLTAANVASAVALLNASEIAEGQTAVRKAQNADVKRFAQEMVDDHRKLQKAVDSVALAKNITPQAPPDAAAMEQKTKSLEDSLRALSGAAFDRAFVGAQVTGHE